MTDLIVYACPVGPLARQIEAYLEKSQQTIGRNAAHAYMPHCTLTGFFSDEKSAIPIYLSALEKVLCEHSQHISNPPITIEEILFREKWHGLALKANWLKQMVADFAQQAHSPTRTESLRLKDWLHLSLAYNFKLEDGEMLEQLAKEMIAPSAEVAWEIRFYEREQNRSTPEPLHNRWLCHGSWPI
ncbi:MAG: hypothetical protein AAFU53_19250 [Cyanobacteria bacterium J06632_3]